MRFSLLDRESNCHNYIFQYDDISIIISFNQVCVVALFSILWVVVGGWFDGMEDFDKSSLTWELLWDWMVSFPWVPALYTGIFSTGLCLWIEVLFFNILVLEERTLNNGSHFTSDFFFFFNRLLQCVKCQQQKQPLFMEWSPYGELVLHGFCLAKDGVQPGGLGQLFC